MSTPTTTTIVMEDRHKEEFLRQELRLMWHHARNVAMVLTPVEYPLYLDRIKLGLTPNSMDDRVLLDLVTEAIEPNKISEVM